MKVLTKTNDRVRTLTGKEIELDIEPDYKVRTANLPQDDPQPWSDPEADRRPTNRSRR